MGQQNIIRPPNPTRVEQSEQITAEHFMGLMGDVQSVSSGYQSGHSGQSVVTKPDMVGNNPTPSKEQISKTAALQQMFGRPITPTDCETMKTVLDNMGSRSAYKNVYKGPDSFFYCIAKLVPNLNTSGEAPVMVLAVRSGLAKFVTENKTFCHVSMTCAQYLAA